MNIRPDSSPVSSSGPVRSEGADVRGARAGRARAASAPAEGDDRVELSAEGRAGARVRQAGAESPEVESARVALRALDGLGPERLHELRERVRTGYYDRPEAIDRIAAAATADLRKA